MSNWITRTAKVRSRVDPRQWASMTLAVRPRPKGLRIISRLIPGNVVTFERGNWTEKENPADEAENRRLLMHLVTAEVSISPPTPRGCQGAALSGVFFAKNFVSTERVEIELLDMSGYTTDDATPFAVATTAALIAALDPKAEFADIKLSDDWEMAEIRSR